MAAQTRVSTCVGGIVGHTCMEAGQMDISWDPKVRGSQSPVGWDTSVSRTGEHPMGA